MTEESLKDKDLEEFQRIGKLLGEKRGFKEVSCLTYKDHDKERVILKKKIFDFDQIEPSDDDYEVRDDGDVDEDEKELASVLNALRRVYIDQENEEQFARPALELRFEKFSAVALEVGGKKFTLNDLSNNPSALDSFLEPAPFGDMKDNTTKVDESVRCARRLDDFKVLFNGEEGLEEELAKTLRASRSVFRDADVTVKPHSFNVYTTGGHFDWHLDTQREENMLGTITMVFGNYKGGILRVAYDNAKTKVDVLASNWSSRAVAMLCSCPHKVEEVESGTRFSITFDVFGELAKLGEDANPFDKFVALAKKILAEKPEVPAIGVLLAHCYSENDIEKGQFRAEEDRLLIAAAPGAVVQPMIWSREYEDVPNEEFRLAENCIYTLDSKVQERFKNALFFDGYHATGALPWEAITEEIQESAEHTGNEALIGHDDRIYRVCFLMIEKD